MDCFVASLLAMTKESPLAAEFQLSTGPQHFGPVADHLRLLRQRHRGRHQDHQRLLRANTAALMAPASEVWPQRHRNGPNWRCAYPRRPTCDAPEPDNV